MRPQAARLLRICKRKDSGTAPAAGTPLWYHLAGMADGLPLLRRQCGDRNASHCIERRDDPVCPSAERDREIEHVGRGRRQTKARTHVADRALVDDLPEQAARGRITQIEMQCEMS